MTKKTPVDPDDLMNELRGKSTYFAQKGDRTGNAGDTSGLTERDSDIARKARNRSPKILTERTSFELYPDQKKLIKDVQMRYYQQTGEQLSKSAIVREALEQYLPKLLEALGGEED